ncbi:MAG: glycosyltransferase family 4 protein [Bacteroidales bacterium]|nr:glycosyltransferase family 4 protein [Bacteroidales bacterium]
MKEQSGHKILFINQATGYLMKDVINEFCAEYDDVVLLAGHVSDIGGSLNQKVAIRLIHKYNKKNRSNRFFSWIWGTIQAILLISLQYRKYHLVITSNPPTLAFLPLFCRNKYSVIIYDVYPDGLVAGGFISETSCVNRLWIKQNIRYYNKASNIYTLTESMADTLSKYVPREKIKVIVPWSLFSGSSKVKKEENIFIKKYNLSNFFLVMYSGNIGLGHNVESLIEVARVLRNVNDIKFVIIGDGWNKALIEKRISEFGLINCLLLPFQPSNMFRHSLSAADIGVVSVTSAASKVCAPSKTYNLINLEIPLLCITDHETELAKIVNSNEIGKVCNNSQYEEMAEFILSFKNDCSLYQSISDNLKRCSNNYTIENAHKYLINFRNN